MKDRKDMMGRMSKNTVKERRSFRERFFNKRGRRVAGILGVAALMAVLGFTVLRPAFAAEVEKVPGSSSANRDFAKKLSVSEIRIDTGKVNQNGSVLPVITEGSFAIQDGAGLRYTGTINTNGVTTVPCKITYTYPNAAILPDGTTKDLIIRITEVEFTANGESNATGEPKLLGTGGGTHFSSGMIGGSNSEPYRYGFRANMKHTVEIDGVPGDYTYLYSAYGFNAYSGGYKSYVGFDQLYPEKSAEAAYISGNAKVYLPGDYSSDISTDNGTVKLGPSGTTNAGDDTNYTSGFAMDGKSGTTIIYGEMGSSGNNNNERIYLGVMTNSHTVSSGEHGAIATTKGTDKETANADGELGDTTTILSGGTESKPLTYGVPFLKNVLYTMTPNTGYKGDKLAVDGQTFDLSKMKKGDTRTFGIYTVEYRDNGKYVLTVPGSTADHKIHVTWTATTADILASKIWTDKDDLHGVRAANADQLPSLKLQQRTNKNGSTSSWTDVESPANVPIGESYGQLKDGTYAIEASGSSTAHPFTWEYLPVYTYDSNGDIDGKYEYRIVEDPDPGISGYKKAVYSDPDGFDLISAMPADQADKYKETSVANEYDDEPVYVKVIKEWDDASLYGIEATDGNEYDRTKVTFTLSGSSPSGPVDINPSDSSSNSLTLSIEKDENQSEEDATGNREVEGLTIYQSTSGALYVQKSDGLYYDVTQSGDTYSIGAESDPQPLQSDLTPLKKGDGTYKIDKDHFGALFEDLPAYDDKGKLITYSVTEATIDGWTTIGGSLTPVYDGGNIIGYKTTFANKPVEDAEYTPVPLTVSKKDADTGEVLKGAQFTVYTNPVNRTKATENEGDTTGQVVKNEVTTNEAGEATITFNKVGTYYVVETTAPNGYKADTTIYQYDIDARLKKVTLRESDTTHDTKWWESVFDLVFGPDNPTQDNWEPASDQRSGSLTIEDEPIKANVLVRKIWDDDGDRDGLRPDDGDTGMPTVTLEMTTAENPTEDDWKTVKIIDPDDSSQDPQKIDATATVTHNGGSVLTHQHDAYTWSDLPAYESGKIITYRVKETGDVLADDTYYVKHNWTSDKHEETFQLIDLSGDTPKALNQTVDVTNAHITQKIHIEAKKTWEDDNDVTKRTEAKLTLYKTVNGATTALSDVGTVPTETTSDVIKEWTDLPVYEAGYPVTYRIAEASIPSYETKYSVTYIDKDETGSEETTEKTDSLDATKVKRTFDPENPKAETTKAAFMVSNIELQDITTTKYWINGANANVRFTLYRTTQTELTTSDWKQVPSQKDPSIEITTWTPFNSDDELVDGWEKVPGGEHLFVSSAFSTETSEPGDDETHVFEGLPKYDENNRKYQYRVLETTTSGSTTDDRFDANYNENGITITNTNIKTTSGTADVDVVKDLKGREWKDDDVFYFRIDPIKDYDEENNQPVEYDDTQADQEAKAKVPLPGQAHKQDPRKEFVVGTAKEVNTVVAVTGREVSFSPIIYDLDDLGDEQSKTYYYKVYEVTDREGMTPVSEKDDAGITYDGKKTGDNWQRKVSYLKVVATKDSEGKITTEHFWDYDAQKSRWNIATPNFVNTYESKGIAKIWVEKSIQGRQWKEFDGASGDAFQFDIWGISGAQLNMTDYGEDSYTTKPMTKNTSGDYQYNTDKQLLSDNEVVVGISGNPYTGDMLNSEGYRYFIYAISETGQVTYTGDGGGDISDYRVDDLDYDDHTIYARLKAQDNWDGTIDFEIEYFRDAACKNKITGHEVWIHDDGTHTDSGKTLLTPGQAAAAEAMNKDEQKAAGYRKVNVAYFTNTATVDIPVTKEWKDGPPVEDVTLHLRRHLFTLKEETSLTDDYVESAESRWDGTGDFWESIGRVYHVKRGDFYNEDGSQQIITSKDYDNIEGFNKDLPLYVEKDGQTYRAVYQISEDDTSDAYETSYRSEPDIGEAQQDDQIFIDSGRMVVTNSVTATNTANIAAVKQLLGRNWEETDSFEFMLEQTGKAVYDAETGEIADIDDSNEAKESVPMPDEVIAEAPDAEGTIVDPNGGQERLARFGEIEFKVSDLSYDPVDKHHQGDFFYTMREVIPSDAKNADGKTYGEATDEEKAAGGFTKAGIVYDNDEHTVHIKVRENRTGTLVVQIGYDEDTPGDISTGTQFTPVYTNKYNAETTATVGVKKYIMGRNWKTGDNFDFVMIPMAGAPFRDADPHEFPDENTKTDQDREAALGQGLAIHNKDGQHVRRMNIVTGGGAEVQRITYPELRFFSSDLHQITTDETKLKYSDGSSVPAGKIYEQFMYAIEETDEFDKLNDNVVTDLNKDKDTEYARITVIDKGDGTLDHYVEVFGDRYASVRREDPKTGEDATEGIFVNQWKRDLTATKAWDGIATENVTLRLQWSINGTNWYNVDGTSWLSDIVGHKTISKNATGDELSVEWKDLPAYVNTQEDNLSLNDEWVYYRVIEDQPVKADVRYNREAYVKGDTINTEKYREKPFHTGDEKDGDAYVDPDARIKQLYVTNFPKEIEGKAKVGVVKQLIGKDWEDEEFTFEITPVKSKLGGADDYTEYDATANPMPVFNNHRATASVSTDKISVNEHGAQFRPLTIKRSDLKLDDADGLVKGEFIYKVKEVIPPDAVEMTAGGKTFYVYNGIKYTTEEHQVKIVAVDDGSDSLDIRVSYDDRSAEDFDFVPVYTNYQMTTTPISGTKTWVGGETDEHVNGTVTLDGTDKIAESTDKLNLKLQRSVKGREAVDDVTKDEADRDLVIVWVKETKTTAEQPTGRYIYDGAVIDADDYAQLSADEKAKCTEETETVTTITYDKQESGDGIYTVLAKDGDDYVDPILKAVDKDGNEYSYSVKETSVPEGYEEKYDGLNITNTNTSGEMKVIVMKKWADNNDQDGKRLNSVKVKISAEGWNGKDIDGKQVNDITLNDDNNWKDVFKKLPKQNSDGVDYAYTIDEVTTLPQGYTKKIEYQSVEGNWSETKPTDWNNKVRITNSYTPEEVTIQAKKVWDDKGVADAADLHTKVTLHLYGKDKDGKIVYDGGTKEIAKDSTDIVQWTKQPKYHYDNTELAWEVVEDAVFGFTAKVELVDGVYVVTNTYTGPTTKISVEKEWADDDNVDGKRPKSLTFRLYKKVGADGEKTLVSEKMVPVQKSGTATYTWYDLSTEDKQTQTIPGETKTQQVTRPATQEDVDAALAEDPESTLQVGDEITVEEETTVEERTETTTPILYSVEEAEVPEYTSVVAAIEPGKFKVINTHERKLQDIHIVKVWNDNEDHDKTRPDHITVRLMNGETEVKKTTLSEDDHWLLNDEKPGWSHTFKGVPVYDDGREIDYSVAESGVPSGYTSKTKETTPEGAAYKQFTITNTRANDVKLTVTKVWTGDEKDKSHRDNVKLRLIKVIDGARKDMGDEYAKEIEYDPNDPDKTMTDTWENLPISEKGKIVSYTVEEEPIAGYAVTYSDVTRKEATPNEGDNPMKEGWFEKDDDKYVPTKDETVDPDKTYYTDEYEVTVTNKFNSGGGELSGDVLYVDPKNEAGQMIVGSTRYGTKNQAESAAEKQQGKPPAPSHAGYNFLGWALNKDENDNWVLVATYADVPPTAKPITTYIDPQSGKPLLVSGANIKKPANPKHDGMIFVKWVKTKDAAGNTIYVAKFKCDSKSSSSSGSTPTKKAYSPRNENLKRVTVVDTGDGAQLPLMVLFLTVSGAFAAAVIIRRRREDARRDNAA